MASRSPAHPPARGPPSVPRLPTRPSPRAAFSRTQAGTVQGAGRDNREPLWLVSGDAIGGLGWVGRGRQGQEGSGGPKDGGAAGESRSLMGQHRAAPLWAGNLGHPGF